MNAQHTGADQMTPTEPEDHTKPPSVTIEWCNQAIAERLGYDGSRPDSWPMNLIDRLQRLAVEAGNREMHLCIMRMA
jgi:hypothetical protein